MSWGQHEAGQQEPWGSLLLFHSFGAFWTKVSSSPSTLYKFSFEGYHGSCGYLANGIHCNFLGAAFDSAAAERCVMVTVAGFECGGVFLHTREFFCRDRKRGRRGMLILMHSTPCMIMVNIVVVIVIWVLTITARRPLAVTTIDIIIIAFAVMSN